MNPTTQQILTILADGLFYSGQNLAERLQLSRTAVFKHIKTLQSMGLMINAISGKGYQLAQAICLLDKQQLQQAAADTHLDLSISCTSTNVLCTQWAAQHSDKDFIAISEQQTSGRGRRGKQWQSPFAQNIYLSYYHQFDLPAGKLTGLSLALGVMLANVLQQQGIKDIQLKWPNDVYVASQKIAGILVEMTGDLHGPAQVVMGMGINVNMQQQAEINQPWTSCQQLLQRNIDRNQIIKLLIPQIKQTIKQYEQQGLSPFMQQWRELDYLFEKPITIEQQQSQLHATAHGIDEQGLLLIKNNNNEIHKIHSGDVSVRMG